MIKKYITKALCQNFLLYLFFYLYFQAILSILKVTICNQSPISRPDMWRHAARGHSICHRPLGLHTHKRSIFTKPFPKFCFLSILGSRHGPSRVTWSHRSRDHSIPRWPIPVGVPMSPNLYLQPFSRQWAPNILEPQPWPSTVTWRHRSRNHSIPRWSFPIGAPLSPSRFLQPFRR